MNVVFHYPPELLSLLIDAIPLMFRSKADVLLFFKGAGVPEKLFSDLSQKVAQDRENIRKHEIVRAVLTRLNEGGERTLRERREVLKRVTEFEDFSTCWPSDELKAKGLVAEIRRVVGVKDSFTRMRLERESEQQKHRDQQREKLEAVRRRTEELAAVKAQLYSLFPEQDSHTRGKALEKVLNRLFAVSEIQIRESFSLKGPSGEGIVEQIDGVVEIDGHLYLVEMKWWDQPLGRPEVSEHLVRIFTRGHARGIFISASGYTQPAVLTCRESLSKCVIVLCELQEVVTLLEQATDLKLFLKRKIDAAVVDKDPLYRPPT